MTVASPIARIRPPSFDGYRHVAAEATPVSMTLLWTNVDKSGPGLREPLDVGKNRPGLLLRRVRGYGALAGVAAGHNSGFISVFWRYEP